MAGLLQRLPWLLFGLYAGVVADRHDRRLIVVAVDLARAIVLGVLAVTILTGSVNVAVILATMFVLGTAEAFSDITTGTLLPMLVDKPDLGVARCDRHTDNPRSRHPYERTLRSLCRRSRGKRPLCLLPAHLPRER